MNRTAALAWSVAVSAGVLTACGGGSQSPPAATSATAVPSASAPASTPAQPAAQIVISNFAFAVPAPVRPGQQVTVINNDDAAHTVTSDANDLFDVRVSGGGGFATFTAPATPGSYPIHCKYHADMHGALVVQ